MLRNPGMDMQFLEAFAVNVPATELVLRGTAIYLLLFPIFRFLVRREIGRFGVAEMLVLVLIVETSQGSMTGEFTTLTEGAILAGTILGWNLLFRLGLVLRHRVVRYRRHVRTCEPRSGTDQSCPAARAMRARPAWHGPCS